MSRHTGARAETLGAVYLQARGLKLLARNFTCRAGEIDLVMRAPKPVCVVFVEVRYRRNNRFGSPAATVTAAKQLRLARAASWYLANRPCLAALPARFDVLGIEGPLWCPRFEWLQSAFELDTSGIHH